MLSNHLILSHFLHLLPSIFPSIIVFSDKSTLRNRWPKYWSFSFSISLSNEYSGLISYMITGLVSLLSKGLSRVFSSTTIWKHQFFSTQFSLWSNSHIHTWLTGKTITLTIGTFVTEVIDSVWGLHGWVFSKLRSKEGSKALANQMERSTDLREIESILYHKAFQSPWVTRGRCIYWGEMWTSIWALAEHLLSLVVSWSTLGESWYVLMEEEKAPWLH